VNRQRLLPALVFIWLTMLHPIGSASWAQPRPGEAPRDYHGARLIMEDLGHYPVWCGNRAIAIGNQKVGLQWIDVIDGRQKTLIADPYANPTACTTDGEWVIYEDKKTGREDPRPEGKRLVVDFVRISTSSGNRERLGFAADGGLLSPDEKRVLFYRPAMLEMSVLQVPRWDGTVLTTEWPLAGGTQAAWLSDSRRVLISHRGKFWIEQGGRLEPIELRGDAPGNVLWIKVDTADRVHLFGEIRGESDRRLLRCRVMPDAFRCGDLALGVRRVRAHGVSGDGKRIAFIGDDGRTESQACVWLFQEGEPTSRCVWRWAHARDQLWLAPDGQRLLVTRSRSVDLATGMGLGPVDVYALDLTP
jgi:hypothetical protein